VVLLQVLVLQGGVAVVYGHGQLPLAQQPLFSQVVVNLVLGFSQMIWNAILVHVVWVGDAMCLGSLHSIISNISMAHNIPQQEAAHIARGEGVQGHPATGTHQVADVEFVGKPITRVLVVVTQQGQSCQVAKSSSHSSHSTHSTHSSH